MNQPYYESTLGGQRGSVGQNYFSSFRPLHNKPTPATESKPRTVAGSGTVVVPAGVRE